MKVREIISELTYQGRKCTKDCGGHAAGYQWAMTRNYTAPCNSHSPSFNDGCDIAATQIKNKKIVRPKVRDNSGRFVRATYRRR